MSLAKHRLEQEVHRRLQCAAASYSIYATLAAADGVRDLSETGCRAAVIGVAKVCIEGELRGVAQLKRLDACFHGGFSEEVEALEE